MNQAGKFLSAAVTIFVLSLSLLFAQDSPPQQTTGTLSGIVTDPSGKVLAEANVSIKNLATGETRAVQTDPSGVYQVAGLPAGEYEVSASMGGLGGSPARVSLSPGAQQTLNLSLTSGPGPAENLPNAPSATKTEPSLEDLGFSRTETQANAAQQALLDKRTRMLKIHQRMGLITTIPMIVSVVTSLNAGGKSEGTASRDLHVALGALTGDLYGITAYYAIRAPRIPGAKKRGPIKVHEALAWIHGPGMILTPILGAMAFNQKNNGQKVHGIAAAHGPVAIVTAGAFGAALLSVSVKF
jgi:hypothetical protein